MSLHAPPAAGEHQQRMGQHTAPVMDRGAPAAAAGRHRQSPPQPHTVSETPRSEQPRAPNHPTPATGQTRILDTADLHRGNASLPGIETCTHTRIIPPQRGSSADAHPHHPTTREQSGLESRILKRLDGRDYSMAKLCEDALDETIYKETHVKPVVDRLIEQRKVELASTGRSYEDRILRLAEQRLF